MFLKRAGILLAAFLAMGAAPQNPLVRARQFYNQQQYDAAIVAARQAAGRPNLANIAGLVLARAHLERYRSSADAADLAAARAGLAEVDVTGLTPRDRLDLTVGFGELLYFDGHFGAAAEMFGAVLGSAGATVSADRECLLDWWAIALEHEAQSASDAERRRIYARITGRMEEWVTADPPSAVAMYWLAAARAGADEPDRAWNAAAAAWIRAPLAASPSASLRADLEQLVQLVIIPMRAQASGSAGDARSAVAAMQSEWDAIKGMGIRR
jgi:hypothetical protein